MFDLAKNPVEIANFITTLGAAIIALLVAFGIPISLEQKAAILAVLGILAPVVATLITRRLVTPLAAPKSESGIPLVEKGTGLPTRAAAARMRKEVEKEAKEEARRRSRMPFP